MSKCFASELHLYSFKHIYFKIEKDELLIIVVYVDDLIFGCNNDKMSHEFVEVMAREFEMSMNGELSFFLGLQISQSSKGFFISQSKYLKEMLKKLEWMNVPL